MQKSPENSEISALTLDTCYEYKVYKIIISRFLKERKKYYIDMLNYFNRGVRLRGKEDKEYYESMLSIVNGSIVSLEEKEGLILAFKLLGLEVERSLVKIGKFLALGTPEAQNLVQEEILKIEVYEQVFMSFENLGFKLEVAQTRKKVQQMQEEVRKKYKNIII